MYSSTINLISSGGTTTPVQHYEIGCLVKDEKLTNSSSLVKVCLMKWIVLFAIGNSSCPDHQFCHSASEKVQPETCSFEVNFDSFMASNTIACFCPSKPVSSDNMCNAKLACFEDSFVSARCVEIKSWKGPANFAFLATSVALALFKPNFSKSAARSVILEASGFICFDVAFYESYYRLPSFCELTTFKMELYGLSK